MSLLRHMLDNGLLIPRQGVTRNFRAVDCHDGAGAPLIDTRPWLLAFNVDGLGKDMARLRSAIGERRIDEAMAQAEAFMEHNVNHLSCDTRLVPMGVGQDHVEELAWVPADWKATSYTPEGLRSLGTPWLLSRDIAAARTDPGHWLAPGFGHCLSVQRGDMVACLIPASLLTERGSTMHDCVTFMCELPWKSCEELVLTNCLFAELVPGHALWVPYGWRCVLLTRTATTISHVLHIPYACTRMLQAAASKKDILVFAKQATADWSSSMGCEPSLLWRKRHRIGLTMWPRWMTTLQLLRPSRRKQLRMHAISTLVQVAWHVVVDNTCAMRGTSIARRAPAEMTLSNLVRA